MDVMVFLCLVCLLLGLAVSYTANADGHERSAFAGDISQRLLNSEALTDRCAELFYGNFVDHFDGTNNDRFQQRYFVCPLKKEATGTYLANAGVDLSSTSPQAIGELFADAKVIFFYTGNEANVEMYVQATGLMWEHQVEFEAVLVFAEMRYFGKSIPSKELRYFTVEQQLEDYAALINYLQKEQQDWRGNTLKSGKAGRLPLIAFGGSYGGMLTAMLRAKYPNVVDGGISASAPLALYEGIIKQPIDKNKYWQAVTEAASRNKGCVASTRAAFKHLFKVAESSSGRKQLGRVFNLCEKSRLDLETGKVDVLKLAMFLAMAWDNMAMGNFPYPSSYMTGDPAVLLPTFPVDVSCGFMTQRLSESQSSTCFTSTSCLLERLDRAAAVFNNASRTVECYELPPDDAYGELWDIGVCLENLPQECVADMFFKRPYTEQLLAKRCLEKFGFSFSKRASRLGDMFRDYFLPFDDSGKVQFQPLASKLVFSYGDLDPWSVGAITNNYTTQDVHSVFVEGGAHHLDLFFSHENDPPSVNFVRAFQVDKMKKWVAEVELSRTLQAEVSTSFRKVEH